MAVKMTNLRHSLLPPLALALVGLAGCGVEPVKKPPAPDMSSTVEAFAAPSAPLNAETLEQSLEGLLEQADLLTLLGVDALALDLIVEGLAATDDDQEAEQGLRVARQGLEVEGAGFLRVSRICPGVEGSADPDPANGTMDFVVPFTEKGLDPVLWGSFNNCRYLSSDQEVLLGSGSRAEIGDVRLFVGDSLQFGSFGQTDIIFELDVNYTLDGFANTLQIDFKVLIDGGLELRLDVEGGRHMIGVIKGGFLGFRANNGDWSCNLQEKRCVDSLSNDSFGF